MIRISERPSCLSIALVLILCAIAALAVNLHIAPRQIEYDLSLADVHPLKGHAYAAVLPRPWAAPLFTNAGDTYSETQSRLRLVENGIRLGQPHATMAAVQNLGEGTYLHLRETELYFSASDNTDPRRNGRTYRVVLPQPLAPEIVSALFGLAAAAVAFLVARVRFEFPNVRAPYRTAIALIGFAALAAAWQFLVLTPAPMVVPSGDGGNVVSIVAASMHPRLFVDDVVFGNPGNFAFYVTVLRPLVAFNYLLTSDLGQAYMLLQWPLLFAQMTGFFLLGRALFGGHGWPVALALLSVPPVYIFGGELWGNLSAPLTRSVFAALFPFLILIALPPHRQWTAYAAMALCGLSVYVHPVSAPSVALAIWLTLLVSPRANLSWSHHAMVMIAAGALFVLIALPFGMQFVGSMSTISAPVAGEMRAAAKAAIGPQYYDVRIAVSMALNGGVNNPHDGWGWRFVLWMVAIVFLATVAWRQPVSSKLRFIALMLPAMLVASIGITALDQIATYLLGRAPLQIDLIRNLRFVIPLLLIGIVGALATWHRRHETGTVKSGALVSAGVLLCVVWWRSYPNPISTALFQVFAPARSADVISGLLDERNVLAHLQRLPEKSRILLLPQDGAAERHELLGLAIRYASWKPMVHLRKDMNFLLYSGSPELTQWAANERLVQLLSGTAEAGAVSKGLSSLLDQGKVDYVLLYRKDATATLSRAIATSGTLAAEVGPWSLYRMSLTAK